MADPATYRPTPGSIPEEPGVYRFRDQHARVIYVGKAKNLRSRLNSYFHDLAQLHQRTQTMVQSAASVEWTVVQTEVEALVLEYQWIKEFDPRFNVRYRDDKSYPYLAITTSEEFPRVLVMRGAKRSGTTYFGPYAHAWAIRETLDLLLRVFPVRSCSSGVFKRAAQTNRACLLGYIDKCSAPCVGQISADDHKGLVKELISFLSGDTGRFVRRLEKEMKEASSAQEFELAARLRDRLAAIERVVESNSVVLSDATDADVIAVRADLLEAAVSVFHVRGGRVKGERAFVVDLVEDITEAGLMEHLLQNLYSEESKDIPREILTSVEPDNVANLESWLSGIKSTKVEIRRPQRGDKRELMQTVARNAEQALVLHQSKRSTDLTARSQALAELQDALGLDEAPLRIECYDISNLAEHDMVASMVVFEDGLAKKSDYRKFAVREEDGKAPDDTRAIYQVLSRRLKRLREDRESLANISGEVEAGASARRFSYPPQLIVVDGGAPQVAAAARALSDQGITDVALCGLAKRMEEVWLPEQTDPIILPRQSQGLYLLQRIRDEAHRFAITYHRSKRSATMLDSLLDQIPGLGEGRRRALISHFGSVAAMRKASVEEIAAVPGVGPRTAETIASALAIQEPNVDLATGEILE